MTIGEKIKQLRKKNDLTQEKLAEYLNVSYQAISKWECGLSSPDLSLIGPLTKLLHVSADELLGLTAEEVDERRIELEKAHDKTWETGDLKERYRISQILVSEYPGEMKYLDWLAWCEAMGSFEVADDAEYAAVQEKAIKHFSVVIENATDERVKASSIQGIVQYLAFRGRHEEAKRYAELYPENYSVSRDDVWLSCLQGEEWVEEYQCITHTRFQRFIGFLQEAMRGSMNACVAQEKIIQAMIPDGNYFYENCYLADNYLARARIYARNNQPEEAIEALKRAKQYAVAFDAFMNGPQEYRYTSPFFHKVKLQLKDIYRSGASTMMEDFYEALGRKVFDSLREREDFQALF